MEPLINTLSKRKTAGFIPYRRINDRYEYFLQKRDMTTKTNPGLFGIFGGGVEDGESFEDGFRRECMEELAYTPISARCFCRYEMSTVVMDVFIEKVGADFETQIEVLEGEYGKFMTREQIENETQISLLAKMTFLQLDDFLVKETI
jgi:8-oxo-dGTP pyrophosphatase MutT (NUDIX family)